MQSSSILMDLLYLIKVSRPRFWLYIAGPVLLGLGTYVDAYAVYLFIYFLLPANLFLYGVNDIWDRDTDAINSKKDIKETRVESAKQIHVLKSATLVSVLLSLPLFIWGNDLARILLGVFFTISYFYSAPPLRFKALPFLDSLSNVLYVMPGLMAYAHKSGSLPPLNILVAAALWTWAMHLFSAIPDITPDEKSGIRTTAVVFGEQRSLLLCGFYWGLATYMVSSTLPLLIAGLIYTSIPVGLYLTGSHIQRISHVYWYYPIINGIMGFGLYLYSVMI